MECRFDNDMSLNTKFTGTGGMTKFVAESTKMFSAINNATIEMPFEYKGQTPTISISGGDSPALVIDMKDAAVFTENNVQWSLWDNSLGAFVAPESYFISMDIRIENGVLKIDLVVP